MCDCSKMGPALHYHVLHCVEDTEVQTQLGHKYVALLLFVLVKYILQANPVTKQDV